jgi:iron complex transport system substrate-binding protein
VNADGSSQAQVIGFIGAKNAVAQNKATNKGGGTIVSLESLYQNEPDVIILTKDGPYDDLRKNEWSKLSAVKKGKYYEIPDAPFCWMSQPPSVNMVLGVWWLGQLVYPDVYNDYDMVKVAQEYYKLFWHYDLSEKEAKEMLARSYYK